MTAVTSSLASILAPAAAPGARRGAGDSSDAFGRSLAAVSDEAAGQAGTPSPGEGPGVVGTLPDGAAHPGIPGAPGVPGGQRSPGTLVEGIVPGESGTGTASDGVLGSEDTDGTDGTGEGTGVEEAVVVDGQPPAALPVVPSPVPPGSAVPTGSAVLPEPVGPPVTAGPVDPGTATGVVGPSSAGPEEQATGPVPPAGSAASTAGDPGASVGRAAAGSTALRGASTATGETAPTDARPVGDTAAPPVAAGQASGGGAGGTSEGYRQPAGGPVVSAPAVTTTPVAAPGARVRADAGTAAEVTAEPTAAPGQVVPAPGPVVQAPVSAAVGQVVPAPATPQAAPTLHAQVSGPVFQLLDAGDGDHVLTLSVTPDNLGPVTVRAHIAGGELRIELFAPHDAGREALRALAAELRRDLAGIAPTASLSVSDAKEAPAQGTGHQAGAGHGNAGDGGAGNGATGRPGEGHPWQSRPGARTGVPGATTDQTIQPTVDDTTPGATRRLDVLV
ncbi:flagellar hook-length control protein FliK [Oerskovia sp. NPDC056781]|uniref:flagellar hook-length control protein FliK n=1 Tax=Oerskovia sp. NPDC056781 TaxID=3345942 RepID=UPI00366ABE44